MRVEIRTKETNLTIHARRITITLDEFAEEFFTVVEQPMFVVTVYRHGKTVDDVKPLLKFGDLESYRLKSEVEDDGKLVY